MVGFVVSNTCNWQCYWELPQGSHIILISNKEELSMYFFYPKHFIWKNCFYICVISSRYIFNLPMKVAAYIRCSLQKPFTLQICEQVFHNWHCIFSNVAIKMLNICISVNFFLVCKLLYDTFFIVHKILNKNKEFLKNVSNTWCIRWSPLIYLTAK